MVLKRSAPPGVGGQLQRGAAGGRGSRGGGGGGRRRGGRAVGAAEPERGRAGGGRAAAGDHGGETRGRGGESGSHGLHGAAGRVHLPTRPWSHCDQGPMRCPPARRHPRSEMRRLRSSPRRPVRAQRPASWCSRWRWSACSPSARTSRCNGRAARRQAGHRAGRERRRRAFSDRARACSTRTSAALAKLDRVVRFYAPRRPGRAGEALGQSGRIVYSDEPRLIGKRFAPAPDERELFLPPRARRADVERPRARPENRFEQGRGPLREVYLGIRARTRQQAAVRDLPARGRDLAPRAERVARRDPDRPRRPARAVAGAGPARLVALAPSAARPKAPGGHGLRARAATLARDPPRRRGPGPGRGLCPRSAPRRTTRPAARSAARSAACGRYFARALPDDLHRQGGQVRAERPPGPAPEPRLDRRDARHRASAWTSAATPRCSFYRTAHEALRNVAAHAQRHRHRPRHQATRSRSPTTARASTGPANDRPHLGLRMLDDLAREHGGALEIRSTPGRGTSILLEAVDPRPG